MPSKPTPRFSILDVADGGRANAKCRSYVSQTFAPAIGPLIYLHRLVRRQWRSAGNGSSVCHGVGGIFLRGSPSQVARCDTAEVTVPTRMSRLVLLRWRRSVRRFAYQAVNIVRASAATAQSRVAFVVSRERPKQAVVSGVLQSHRQKVIDGTRGRMLDVSDHRIAVRLPALVMCMAPTASNHGTPASGNRACFHHVRIADCVARGPQ